MGASFVPDGEGGVRIAGVDSTIAKVQFNGEDTIIGTPVGVTSVVRDSTGHYTVTLDTPTTDLTAVGIASPVGGGPGDLFSKVTVGCTQTSTTTFGVKTYNVVTEAYADAPWQIVIFRPF